MSAEEVELDELFGAYALDAVSDDERLRIEEYLEVNPRSSRGARASRGGGGAGVDRHGWHPKVCGTGSPHRSTRPRRNRPASWRRCWPRPAARPTLWRLLDRRAGSELGSSPGSAVPLPQPPPSSRSSWWPTTARAHRSSPPWRRLAADDGSSIAQLQRDDGAVGAEAIIDAQGHGYLVGEDLPELGADRTYQLWGVIDGDVISLGVLGNDPGIELFSADAPVTALVVTIERAGGVVSNGNPDGAYVGAIA